MTDLYPTGPFPPRHAEPRGAVDLAVRLRDDLFTRAWIEGEGRPALAERLKGAATGGDPDELAGCLADFLATWPVAALIDDARAQWCEEADGEALAVLGRAAGLVRAATGWPTQPDTPWPMPDPAWIEAQAGDGPWTVHRRDRLDGAEAVAAVLRAPLTGEPAAPATCLDVPATDLVDRRAELGRRLARGELRAVRIVGAVDPTPQARLARGELRLEGASQQAVEAWGIAALPAGEVPPFASLLSPAPSGEDGPTLHTRCTRALVPGTPASLRRQVARPVCFLLWDGPHRPLPVDPVVAPALQAAEGGTARAVVLAAVDGREDVLLELIAIGALGA